MSPTWVTAIPFVAALSCLRAEQESARGHVRSEESPESQQPCSVAPENADSALALAPPSLSSRGVHIALYGLPPCSIGPVDLTITKTVIEQRLALGNLDHLRQASVAYV